MPEQLASENILAVNIPEACRRISVGETLLREMMADGRIPFSRLPGAKPHSRGRIVIRVTDLDKLLIATRVDVSRSPAFRDIAHEPRSRSKRTVERELSVPMALMKGHRANEGAPVKSIFTMRRRSKTSQRVKTPSAGAIPLKLGDQR